MFHTHSVKKILLASILLFATNTSLVNAIASSEIAGTSCSKFGSTLTKNGMNYSCIKLGSHLYWNDGVKSAAKKSTVPSNNATNKLSSSNKTSTQGFANSNTSLNLINQSNSGSNQSSPSNISSGSGSKSNSQVSTPIIDQQRTDNLNAAVDTANAMAFSTDNLVQYVSDYLVYLMGGGLPMASAGSTQRESESDLYSKLQGAVSDACSVVQPTVQQLSFLSDTTNYNPSLFSSLDSQALNATIGALNASLESVGNAMMAAAQVDKSYAAKFGFPTPLLSLSKCYSVSDSDGQNLYNSIMSSNPSITNRKTGIAQQDIYSTLVEAMSKKIGYQF